MSDAPTALVLSAIDVTPMPRAGGLVLELVTCEGRTYAAVLHPATAEKLGGALLGHAGELRTIKTQLKPVTVSQGPPDSLDYVI